MTRELYALSTFCRLYNIDPSFIDTLSSEGLISITTNDDGEYIEEEQLHELEVYSRWHYELGINPEGIDALRHMVGRIRQMQEEINSLKSRLRLYEEGEC